MPRYQIIPVVQIRIMKGRYIETFIQRIKTEFTKPLIVVVLESSDQTGKPYVLIELEYIPHMNEEVIFHHLASIGNIAKKFFPDVLVQAHACLEERDIYWTSSMSASIDQLLGIMNAAEGLLSKTIPLAKPPKDGGKCDCHASDFHDEPGRTCKHHRALSEIGTLKKDISEVLRLRDSGEAFQASADNVLRKFNIDHCFLGIKEAMGA